MLFELLRVAMGVQENISRIPTTKEWDLLFKQAQEQSLAGICFAGIHRIVANTDGGFAKIGMTRSQFLEWLGVSIMIQNRNRQINLRCIELQRKLTKDRVQFCILKGQGAGLRYPCELSIYRQSGDIDVWMSGGTDKVVAYVNSIAPTDEITGNHVQFHLFEDTDVEMHFLPVRICNRFANSRLKKWLALQESNQMHHSVSFGDAELNVPTVEFDLVYQLLHIYKHLFNEGIGLRQIMDYYYVLKSKVDDETIQRVQKTVSVLGLDKFASALMWVIREVFCLDDEYLLWAPNKTDGEFLLNEILQMGNFGQGDQRFRLNKDDSHMKRYWQMSSSKWRFINHFPSEVFWQPIDLFLRFFEQRSLRKKISFVSSDTTN